MDREQLTRRQRTEDYEYLWDVLNTSFPARGPMKRLGYDWGSIYKARKGAAEDAVDDLAFARTIGDVFEDFKEKGSKDRYYAHSGLFEPARFRNYQKMYKAFVDGAWEGVNVAERPETGLPSAHPQDLARRPVDSRNRSNI